MYSRRYFNVGGFSLFELLLSITFVFVLLACLNQFYLYSQKVLFAYSVQHQHQVSANKVFTIIREEISKAGAIGCRHIVSGAEVVPYAGHGISLQNYLNVEHSRLHIAYQDFPSATLQKSVHPGALLRIDTGTWLQNGQFLLVSDCLHAEVFKAFHVSRMSDHQIVRTELPLHYAYHSGAEVSKLLSHDIYSDGDLKVKNTISGWVHRYAVNISHLNFVRRGNGVEFSFTTNVNSTEQKWLGYAGFF